MTLTAKEYRERAKTAERRAEKAERFCQGEQSGHRQTERKYLALATQLKTQDKT